MDYPSAIDVLAINDWVLRKAGTVPSAIRDDGVLEAAMMRPRTAAYDEDADLRTQAAILMLGIALAHAFVDGNKRTALVAGDVFLGLNGFMVESDGDEFGRMIHDVVLHHVDQVETITRFAAWLRSRLRPR